ncbi:extracellular solute-binding protein [Alteromonas flava]|uniref:extracellular solute-binding protein n=1 Tax=Alteromonas flava TaxID=2048003 RepID=UPI000C28B669|nr:extracellular solute-binding protein [Alteromonas flava]
MSFKFSLSAVIALLVFSSPSFSAELNVYSARKEALIKPLLDQFSEKTGVEVNLITGNADALITRMQTEGQFSPADVLITTDAGRLVRAKQAEITQPLASSLAQSLIADNLRDADMHWIALTKRARPMMFDPKKVDTSAIKSIFDLADARYRGQICVRSSSNIYNQSMVAALLIEHDTETVEAWAKGIVDNMARAPKGGDRDQIKAVAAGQCSIAIANTYYLAGMLTSADENEREQARQVRVHWADSEAATHINISGIAIAKHAPNVAHAQALIEFMLSAESQRWYAQENNEYPVVKDVPWSELLMSFGEFNAQAVDLQQVGELNDDALRLMDRIGWK